MKQIKYYALVVGIIILSMGQSCKKFWLEERAEKRQAVPTRLKDFQALLDATLDMNNNVIALSEVAADGHYVTELAWAGGNNIGRNSYTWSRNYPYVKLQSWGSMYRRILACNIVLDGMPKAKETLSTNQEQEQWNDIKGQALFNRSMCFFHLAQVFAQPYDMASANTALGIPLRLDSDIQAQSKRSTVQQTYGQIINDTKEAALLLPDVAVTSTRGSKAAAFALLARTYLIMGDYDNALLYSNKSLEIKGALKDYSELSANATTIGGIANFGNPLQNPEILFFDQMYVDDVGSFLSLEYFVDDSLYNLYAQNDLRLTRFFMVNANNSISFKGNYNNAPISNWFCGLATDEVYLVKSECLARLGNTMEAVNVLNSLLVKRFDSTFVPYTAITAEDALSQILAERRKELVLRNLRWSDMRRLMKEDEFKKTLSRDIGGAIYPLEYNSYKYTFPIPDDIMEVSGMQQTAGW